MIDEEPQKVRDIFDSGLRRKPEECSEFVIEACSNCLQKLINAR
jgi:hypothetical protein